METKLNNNYSDLTKQTLKSLGIKSEEDVIGLKKSIEDMFEKGLTIDRVAKLLLITKVKLRRIMLEMEIYPNKSQKDYEYFEKALKIYKILDEVRVIEDVCKRLGMTRHEVTLACKIFNLKPRKATYCIVCGNKIDDSMYNNKKYCSKECTLEKARIKHREKTKEKPLKKCVYCGTEFRGATNAKYCTPKCKEQYAEVKESVEWLQKL